MPHLINNYTKATTVEINAAATEIEVTAAPPGSITLDAPLTLVLYQGTSIEIVKVTQIVGLTLTVERAQEGTTALTWASGSTLASRVTKETFRQLRTKSTEPLTAIIGDIVITGTTTVTASLIGVIAAVGQCIILPDTTEAFVATVVSDSEITLTVGIVNGTQNGVTSLKPYDDTVLTYKSGYKVWR